jgi:hypothetical protein
MDRRVPIRIAAAFALLAASGCQDYNFNPVGHCLIQPGTRRVTLSKITTADVLFVVDDSGSMLGKQALLASQFPRFLDVLARVNKDRVSASLDPFDFHVAVTTTSSYLNEPPLHGATCSSLCPSALGQNVCCLEDASGTLTSPQPPLCKTDADCAGPPYTCKSTCLGLSDVNSYTTTGCCDASNKPQPIVCDRPGQPCGIFDHFYFNDGICTQGYGQTGPYPAGRFMANAAANAILATPAAKAKVLHFDKLLPWASWDWTQAGGYVGTAQSLQDLATAFNNNVKLGSCGSPQEQGLEAARRAIEAQLGVAGLSQPGVARADWLHDNSKLVVVWVTDEDDCSAPYSAGDGVIFPLTYDGCVADANLPAAQQREYAAASYADWFASLGRSFGAAFIVSANNGCVDQSCLPLLCTDPACTSPPATPGTCGGQGVPNRYVALATALRQRDPTTNVIEGSICDPFGDSLGRIARIVKPPDSLPLPTQPSASDVTILRIADASGTTLRTCSRPAPPPTPPIPDPADVSKVSDPSNLAAQAYIDTISSTYDWWFTKTDDQVMPFQRLPTAPSKSVYVNHATGHCEAGAGETYSVDYIGRLPEGGCSSDQACVDALGGRIGDWTCFAGTDALGVCIDPSTSADPGTCVCGPRATICSKG